jgi:predicted nucleic acid-binding protein
VRYLLDTCVVSELVRSRPSPGVVRWVEGRDEDDMLLSVLTLGELRKGVDRLPDGPRRKALDHWLDAELATRFSGRLLAIDAAVATEWGRLLADAERRGGPVALVDSLLAATARVHGLVVVTRNVSHLGRCGAEVVDPWAGA